MIAMDNPEPEPNPFIQSYRLILDILPYKSALKLSLLNKYCWRTFTTKTKRLHLYQENTIDLGFNIFVSKLNVCNLTIKLNPSIILPILPITCEKLTIILSISRIDWSLLDRTKPYALKEIVFEKVQYLHDVSIQNLPLTLEVLHLPILFNSNVTCLESLSRLTHLTFGRNFAMRVNNLPSNLTHLKFGFWFNQPIDNLPSTLTHLTFGEKFNQRVKNLPSTLTYLKFGSTFDQSISRLPPNLKTLIFGWCFIRDIRNLPPTLIKLVFDGLFNKAIDSLPPTLKSLTLGFNFNQTIDHLPNLTHLTLGFNFNQTIDHLPNLTHLTLENRFNQSVDKLPQSLTHLTFGNDFNKPVNFLPHSLTNLTFGLEFNQEIPILPSSLTHLTFGDRFNKSIDNIPIRITNLAFGSDFDQPTLRLASLPHLRHLEFGYQFQHGIYAHSITHLTISLDSTLMLDHNLDALPKTITHLNIIYDSEIIIRDLSNVLLNLTHLGLHHFPDEIPELPEKITHLTIVDSKIVDILSPGKGIMPTLPKSLVHINLPKRRFLSNDVSPGIEVEWR